MTTFVALSTSSKKERDDHAATTDERKTPCSQAPGNDRSTGASGTGRSNAGVNLPRPSGAARRSAVELASEPGPRQTSPRGSLTGNGLRRKHRLSCRARTESKRDPRVGPGICLGGQSRTHLRVGPYRRRQELCSFSTGAKSLPGWLSGVLHTRRGAVPGSEPGTRRWQSTATLETAESH